MTGVLERLNVLIGADISDLESKMSGLGNKLGGISDKLTSMGSKLSAAVTLPLVGVGIASTKMAADAAESASKMEAVFGDATQNMNAWLTDLKSTIPATTAELQGMSSGIQDLLVPLGLTPIAAQGMTKEVVKLAGDLASFNNIPMPQALEKIRAAMVGSYEPALSFGVALSAATVEAKALEMGLIAEGQELDAASRAQAAFASILEGTTAAHGDAARTADSAANSFKFFWREIRELGKTIGDQLLPFVTPMVQRLTDAVGLFQDLSPKTQKVVVTIGALAAAAGPMLVALGGAIALLPTVASAMGALAGPVGIVTLGVGALAAKWIEAEGGIRPAIESLAERFAGFRDEVGPIIEDVSGKAREFGAEISRLYQEHIAPRLTAMFPLFQKMGSIVADLVTVTIIPNLQKLHPVFEALGPSLGAAMDLFTTLGNIVLDVVDAVVLPVFGRMVDGIVSLIVGPLSETIGVATDAIQFLADKFAWLYDVVVGHSYIPDMIDGIGDSFGRLQTVMVQPAVDASNQVATAMDRVAQRREEATAREAAALRQSRDQFEAWGGTLDHVSARSSDALQGLANNAQGAFGSIGASLTDLGGRFDGFMNGLIGEGGVLGKLAGALTGGSGIGSILGSVGKSLLGGLGLGSALNPGGLIAGVGAKLAGKVGGFVKDKVGGLFGGLFGGKKKETSTAPAIYTPSTYSLPSTSFGYQSQCCCDNSSIERSIDSDAASLREFIKEQRVAQEAAIRVQQEGFTQTIAELKRNNEGLDEVRRETRRLQDVAFAR